MNKKIRIMVVDDHFVVRMGLVGSINIEPDMIVEVEASNGQQAIANFRQFRPDIVLMDLKLPDMTGVEATRTICGNSLMLPSSCFPLTTVRKTSISHSRPARALICSKPPLGRN